jgi:cytochrome P450
MFVKKEFGSRPYNTKLRNDYGDVVKLWLFQDLVQVFHPELFMSILRQEWNLPYGAAPGTWPLVQYYANKSHLDSTIPMPMMLIQGEAWKEPRQALQTQMFSPKVADSYQPGIDVVVQDLVTYLRHYPTGKDDNLNQALMEVSFEMLAKILLDRRMGLLDLVDPIEEQGGTTTTTTSNDSLTDEQQFVRSAVEAFHIVGDLLFKPQISNLTILRLLPQWQSLEKNMDQVWDIGMKWLLEVEEKGSDVAMVTRLASHGKMGRKERLVNLVTLLQAGVDTTSNSLAWAVCQLARNPPDMQDRIREEIEVTMKSDGHYKREYLSKMPYLKAFLREVQRVTPTAAGTMRCLPFDVQVGGYQIPKNTTILWNAEAFGNDPTLLGSDPSIFLPDRWLAANLVPDDADPYAPCTVDGFDNIIAPAPILSHPLVSTPFSVGPRMCVGARLAQNEIHSVVTKLVQNFHITLDPPDQPETVAVTRLVMTPEPMPRIRFDPI